MQTTESDNNLKYLSKPKPNKKSIHEDTVHKINNNFLQVDGNVSELDSSIEDETPKEGNPINVIIGNRPPKKTQEARIPSRRIIRRNNKGQISVYLPNIAVYNHRSLWGKFGSFVTECSELDLGVALHSEIWERKESKKHNKKIEELSELHGISYISTPRPNRRGGGSAITVNA